MRLCVAAIKRKEVETIRSHGAHLFTGFLKKAAFCASQSAL